MESPPPASDGKLSRHSVIAAATLVFVALGVSGSLALADSTRPHVLGGDASRYVPEDGHSTVTLERAPEVSLIRHSDSARSIGYSELLLLPNLAVETAVNAHVNPEAAQFWREITRWNSPEGIRQNIELHELSPTGLSLVASVGADVGFVYSPALLELPADVGAGSAWSSEGDAMPGGVLTYRATGTAHAPSAELLALAGLSGADTCIETRITIEYRDTDGESVLDLEQAELWCEGQGRVAIDGSIDGTSVSVAPADASPASPSHLARATTWSDPHDWRAHDSALVYRDAWFGDRSLDVAMSQHPEVTRSGHVIIANHHGHDITALRLNGSEAVRVWHAHPGGQIVSFTVIGDIIIVSTSHRELVAYTHDGDVLWRAPQPDLVVARVAPLPPSRIAIVGLDGTVTVSSAISGEVEWTRSVSADVEHAPVVIDDTIIVIDRAGKMTAFSGSGDIRWRSESTSVSTTMALTDRFVVAAEAGTLVTYSAQTGEALAERHYSGNARELSTIPGLVVFASEEGLFALDPSTLDTVWRAEPALDIITHENHVVAFHRSTAHLIDHEGRDVSTWTLVEHSSASPRFHAAVDDGFLAVAGSRATLVARP